MYLTILLSQTKWADQISFLAMFTQHTSFIFICKIPELFWFDFKAADFFPPKTNDLVLFFSNEMFFVYFFKTHHFFVFVLYRPKQFLCHLLCVVTLDKNWLTDNQSTVCLPVPEESLVTNPSFFYMSWHCWPIHRLSKCHQAIHHSRAVLPEWLPCSTLARRWEGSRGGAPSSQWTKRECCHKWERQRNWERLFINDWWIGALFTETKENVNARIHRAEPTRLNLEL